ncbi:MAG: zinc ribbon domain-containing protein [Lyngbya sp.]|nr:zinc ribbon domain-containing protein [Lyngbya sp.]
MLAWVCGQRGVYFGKVDHRFTSQICPNCGAHTAESWRCRFPSRQTFQDGKKDLSERTHKCPECQYEINRDVAAAKVICNRGIAAVGQIVAARN